MQVSFTNPTAATLPQAELHTLSHAQLLQCANVLHSGWTTANQKAAQVERELRMMTERYREKLDAAELEVREARNNEEDKSEELICVQGHLKAAQKELIELKRAYKLSTETGDGGEVQSASPQKRTLAAIFGKTKRAQADELAAGAAANLSPEEKVSAQKVEIELLKEKLLFAQADIVKLERTVRTQTPLNVTILKEKVATLEEQRLENIQQFQEKAVDAELKEIKLQNALEEIQQLHHLLESTAKASERSRGRGLNATKLRQVIEKAKEQREKDSPPNFSFTMREFMMTEQGGGEGGADRSPDERSLAGDSTLGDASGLYGGTSTADFTSRGGGGGRGGFTSPRPGVHTTERGSQTDSYLVKALDLLQRANDSKDALQKMNADLESDLSALEIEIQKLRAEGKRQQELITKKDELIDKLTKSGHRKEGASTAHSRTSSQSTHEDLNATTSTLHGSALGVGVPERSTTKELKLQLDRSRIRIDEVEKEIAQLSAKTVSQEKENKQLTRSLSLIAEENAKLTHNIQSIANVGPQDLEELIKAKEEAMNLRKKVNMMEADVQANSMSREELMKSHKEVATLQARGKKYLNEIGQLTAKKDKLQKELLQIYAHNEAQKKKIDSLELELKTLAHATGRNEPRSSEGGEGSGGGGSGGGGPTQRPRSSTAAAVASGKSPYVGNPAIVFARRIHLYMDVIHGMLVKQMEDRSMLVGESANLVAFEMCQQSIQLRERVLAIEENETSEGMIAGVLRLEKATLSERTNKLEQELSAEKSISAIRTTELKNTREELERVTEKAKAEQEVHVALRERAGEVETKYNALKLNHERLQKLHKELNSQYNALAQSVRTPSFVKVRGGSVGDDDGVPVSSSPSQDPLLNLRSHSGSFLRDMGASFAEPAGSRIDPRSHSQTDTTASEVEELVLGGSFTTHSIDINVTGGTLNAEDAAKVAEEVAVFTGKPSPPPAGAAASSTAALAVNTTTATASTTAAPSAAGPTPPISRDPSPVAPTLPEPQQIPTTPPPSSSHTTATAGGGGDEAAAPTTNSSRLGMTLSSADEPASPFKPIGSQTNEVWVDSVVRGGLAHKSGLQTGDTILAVSGVPVGSLDDVGAQIAKFMAQSSSFVLTVRPQGADANVKEDVVMDLA